MTTAQIQTLVEGSDNFEIVRDQIAGILASESASQQVLAAAAVPARDPKLWKLRVFTERADPWEFFRDLPDQADAFPVVNVWFDNDAVDLSASNTVEKQKYAATFNIDCYGYGVAVATKNEDGSDGHNPADEKASREAQRVARLCRRFLMASHWTYLGLRGTVGRRMVQSRTAFQPAQDGRPVQRVAGVRLALAVTFNEFSPQYLAAPLEQISITVKRKETGEIYVEATYAADS